MRKWLSVKLMIWAWKLWPANPEVIQFFQTMAIDLAITGKHITRVDPKDFYEPEQKNGE